MANLKYKREDMEPTYQCSGCGLSVDGWMAPYYEQEKEQARDSRSEEIGDLPFYCQDCEKGTYQEMTPDDLGNVATDADLQEFQSACVAYQDRTGASAKEATDYIWGDGDWLPRALGVNNS
jgi:hypothetical protein